jgi:transcriptional regulator with XRE-family HTH domain
MPQSKKASLSEFSIKWQKLLHEKKINATDKSLAAAIGITPGTLVNLKNNKGADGRTLSKISTYFNVPLSYWSTPDPEVSDPMALLKQLVTSQAQTIATQAELIKLLQSKLK